MRATISSSLYTTESSRWNAVQARDPSADGLFVYAVRTTKIYCRPVCKSRRARRANVSFYTRCQDAEREGFRACKRCKPEVRGGMPEEAAAARIRSLVGDNLWKLMMEPEGQTECDSERTGDLARKAQVSKWHFHRVFKEIMNMTPAEYANQQRTFRPGHSILQDEIWTSIFGLDTTPNNTDTDTLDAQYEEPSVEIDWEALINDDAIALPIEAGTFSEAS
ncbi:metal binding domain of Ada-domain-containing protein [Hypoxylon rubiginosum]|uniref:Metal binding domain of Ada-domain-containing protein n=1 Tax=Hypoxylon rubiginosum TaxID=110542 RepID=A0ACC0CLB1_9PEZI|nr:metal binding domain of Ada-domain-containing protein [Hypoxylon rubiginosum]